MARTKSAVKKRQRVRLSAAAGHLYDAEWKKKRLGRVTGFSHQGHPYVLWDGRKTAASYHPSFIEPA
jgi:hypothetical protein